MPERITPYSFLSDPSRAGIQTWGENLVIGNDKLVMKYYGYCDALYHKQLGKLTGRNDLMEYGDAEQLCKRITSAITREPAVIKVSGEKGREDTAKKIQDFIDSVLARNVFGARETEAELHASRKGRGIYALEYADDRKRIILKVFDPANVWPQFDRYGELTGYRVVQESDKTDPDEKMEGAKLMRVDLYTVRDGRTVRTSGYQRVVTKDDVESLQWVEYDTEDGKPVVNKDIGITFLPFVHFNNTPGPETQPLSDMHGVFNALEKLARNDGDTSATADVQAAPPLVIEAPQPSTKSKAEAKRATSNKSSAFSIAPKIVIFTGEAGNRAYILDVSGLLSALKQHDTILHDRIYANSGVTRIGAGAMEGKDWPAWESLAMACGPLLDLVAMKLTIRTDKYAMLAQFIARYGVAKGLLPGIKEDDVKSLVYTVTFPTALPANTQAEREFVLDAYDKRMIDLETALDKLKSTGFDIDVSAVYNRMNRAENFIPADAAQRGGGTAGV